MLATLLGRRRPRGLLRRIDWALDHLLSFEAAFVLFLYSNELKHIIPFDFPIDETVLFAVLAAGAGAIVVYRHGIYLRGLPVVAAAFFFVAWAVISAGWSPSRVLVYEDSAYLLTFTMFSVVAGALIVANQRVRAVRFFVFALGIAMVMAVYGLVIYAQYGDFRRWAGWQDTEGRAYLDFGHTVVNGAGIAFTLAIFSRFGSVRQGIGVAMFAACALFLLVGGGRGPFLGVAVAALVGLATRPPTLGRGRLELPYATVAAMLIFAVFAAYIAYVIMSGNMTTTLSRFIKLFDQAENPAFVRGANRFEYWGTAYAYWLDAPVFGHGLRSFTVMLRGRELPGAHPHNIVLQILAELGVFGLILFGLFFWAGFRQASLARLRRDPLMVCVLLFLITSSMSALFGRDIVGVRKFFFAVSLLALRPPAREMADGEEPDEEEAPAPRQQQQLRQRRPAQGRSRLPAGARLS